MKGKSPRKNLRVQILEGMLEEKSEDETTFQFNQDSEGAEEPKEEPGKIQQQFGFYMTSSSLGRRS